MRVRPLSGQSPYRCSSSGQELARWLDDVADERVQRTGEMALEPPGGLGGAVGAGGDRRQGPPRPLRGRAPGAAHTPARRSPRLPPGRPGGHGDGPKEDGVAGHRGGHLRWVRLGGGAGSVTRLATAEGPSASDPRPGRGLEEATAGVARRRYGRPRTAVDASRYVDLACRSVAPSPEWPAAGSRGRRHPPVVRPRRLPERVSHGRDCP